VRSGFLAACVLAAGPAAWSQDFADHRGSDNEDLPKALTPEITAAVKGADRVETFEVDEGNDYWRTDQQEADRIGAYKITRRGPEEKGPWMTKAAGLLLDPMSYGHRKRCGFAPGVALRFWKGSQHVDVLLCFHCSDLVVLPLPDPKNPYPDLILMAFDPQRPAWLRMAREAFPKDKELQRLPERDPAAVPPWNKRQPWDSPGARH
jgi:hypothetical protein